MFVNYRSWGEIYGDLPPELRSIYKDLPDGQKIRIEDMLLRLVNDPLERGAVGYAIEISDGLASDEPELISIRGSLMRGTMSRKDDMDFVVFPLARDRKESVIRRYETKVREELGLSRRHPLSIYVPRTWSTETFIRDPVVLDWLNPEPSIPGFLYSSAEGYLEAVRGAVNQALSNKYADVIGLDEELRFGLRKRYGLSAHQAKGLTAITDARLVGLNFCERDYEKHAIIELRDEFVLNHFGSKLGRLKRYVKR